MANAKIVLIDPKQGGDYLDLQELPHIEGGIIVVQDAAQTALEGRLASFLSLQRSGQKVL